MTNGEKLIEVFPCIGLYKKAHDGIQINFNSVWFNAEYKEPNTKNDLVVDAVSRAEVLKLMKDNWHTHNGDWAMQESMDDIRALPPVTPIRPKGHWCILKDIYGDIVDAICSNCEHHGHHKWICCPNCGADMREVEE